MSDFLYSNGGSSNLCTDLTNRSMETVLTLAYTETRLPRDSTP